ncbi:MAG: PAS domain S-box protein [Blastocatellia bacterium]|nr:PAS domain S-box protein [Blastocatellia bacterium]
MYNQLFKILFAAQAALAESENSLNALNEASRKSEEHYRALIEQSWDGVLLLTDSGEITYASPSTHRILGHKGDDLIIQNAFALMHPEDSPRIVPQFQLLLSRPAETTTAEFRYQHRDGSWRWLECTATNLLDNPNVEALVINYRDITERKSNEDAVRQARDELERRVRERTAELVAANQSLTEQIAERTRAEAELQRLSHRLVEVQEHERRAIARELHDEIGQILTGLKMTLELTRRLPAAAANDGFARIDQQVNDLLAYVRNLSLDLRPAMLDDLGLLPAIFWHIDRYSAQTGVRVNFKHSGRDGRYAAEIETAIYRIVQEALTNVARHSKVDNVTVLLWSDTDTVNVQIEDRGVGFNKESIFSAGRSNGLAGMRERALLLGGKLTIESSPGAGVCVTAELPLSFSTTSAQQQRPRSHATDAADHAPPAPQPADLS